MLGEQLLRVIILTFSTASAPLLTAVALLHAILIFMRQPMLDRRLNLGLFRGKVVEAMSYGVLSITMAVAGNEEATMLLASTVLLINQINVGVGVILSLTETFTAIAAVICPKTFSKYLPPPPLPAVDVVTLHRAPGDPFGVQLCQSDDVEARGAWVVVSVATDSVAERSRRLKVSDQVVAINGQFLEPSSDIAALILPDDTAMKLCIVRRAKTEGWAQA